MYYLLCHQLKCDIYKLVWTRIDKIKIKFNLKKISQFIRLVLDKRFIILFGFAFSWISATIGMIVKNVETAQVAGFIWVFPLVFASSIFVPVSSMPSWLQSFAKISPITVTVNSVRALSLGLPIGDNIWQSVLWMVGILIVFIPLAIARYRKVT
jgi:ABC-2 type transport system permease protein/oleandomycin transport system permease protein